MLKIDYDLYIDKVYGAWIGKCAGGKIGAKQENNKEQMNYTFDNVFPDSFPPNDDFDLQIMYLQRVLQQKGFNFTADDLADAFMNYNKCWANEYRTAIKNVELGIYPPDSGVFCNDFFKWSNGCPIRSELWALVSPGNPDLAVSLCKKDGFIDHGSESVYAECFFAAMEAEAFFCTDIRTIIIKALGYADKQSELFNCISSVLEWSKNTPDWETARRKLIKKYGSSDASYSVVNAGVTVLALLYGEGFFDKTMLIAVNCGYDTDCTSATAGSVIGIIRGKSGLPKEWLGRIGDDYLVGTATVLRSEGKLGDLAKETFEAAYALIRDGLNDTKIENIPQNFVCNYPKYRVMPEIKVYYEGKPVIRAGEKKTIKIEIVNPYDNEIGGLLTVTPLHGVKTERKEKIKIPAFSSVAFGQDVIGGAEDKGVLRDAVIEFSGAFGALVKRFGFARAAKYNVYGPFFDNYDTTVSDKCPFEGRMPDTLFEMFNGFVNIDKKYLDVDKLGDEIPDEVLFSGEEIVDIESAVNYKGPCVVYLAREFYLDEATDAEIMVGNNAPYKLFLNGEIISQRSDYPLYMPLNDLKPIQLKKGRNRLIYKIARSDKFRFSLFLTKLHREAGALLHMTFDE